MYTKESKYRGNRDSFDFKLAIFHNICGHIDDMSTTCNYVTSVLIFRQVYLELYLIQLSPI